MSETPHGVLPARFERWFASLWQPLAGWLSGLGVSANSLTLISLLMGLLAALLIALGRLPWALIPFGLMGLCDILDGQVAKKSLRVTAFGAILDSSLDRYTEFLIFAGIGIHYAWRGEFWWIFVAALALAGSYQVSYIKARAEGAGRSCRVGLLQRAERLVLLGFGLLFAGSVLKVVLILLAVFTHVTMIERLWHLRRAA